MPFNEKRRCQRFNIELPASFRLHKDQQHLSVATTLDISAKGMSITTKEALKAGQKINVHIRLPNHERVFISTNVIWVKEVYVFAKKEYMAGLAIEEPLQADTAQFVKFCAQVMLTNFKKKSR